MVGGPGGSHGIGLALSVLMTFCFALSVVITRHRRDISMAPAICLSQLLVLVVTAPFAHPLSVGSTDLLLIVALGVGQIGLGLAFLTIGARLIPAAEVALITLLEVVLGPLWVWLALSERPSTATLIGGTVVIGSGRSCRPAEARRPVVRARAASTAGTATSQRSPRSSTIRTSCASRVCRCRHRRTMPRHGSRRTRPAGATARGRRSRSSTRRHARASSGSGSRRRSIPRLGRSSSATSSRRRGAAAGSQRRHSAC